MTEPKRWSEPQAGVDPVLSSVARYAQRLEPDVAAVQRLILATAGRQAPERSPALRRFTVGVALGLAAAFGGVAWASYGARWFGPKQPVVEPRAPRTAPATPEPRALSLAAANPEPLEAASALPLPRMVVPSPPVTPATAAAAVGADSAHADSTHADSALLQQARASVGGDPSRALTLTRDHEVRFPASPLVEERQALRIEALARLGRRSEATRELDGFEARYPRSPYRRRLRSLVSP